LQEAHVVYEKPTVIELGSIAQNTWYAGGSGNCKGGGEIQHLDMHNEWSGGSDANFPGTSPGDVPPECEV
jgi:hypothetical protein